MKTLTVWQPWASLIIEGAKPYEFRGWRAPDSIIGQRIVIHAAARRGKADELHGLLEALKTGGAAAAETCLVPHLAVPIIQKLRWNADGLPFSAGLGTAIVGTPRNGCDVAEEFGLTRANDSERDEHANWAWPMLEIERWDEPVPIRGFQGLWHWPEPADAGL